METLQSAEEYFLEAVSGLNDRVSATVAFFETAFTTLRLQSNFQVPKVWSNCRSHLKDAVEQLPKKTRDVTQTHTRVDIATQTYIRLLRLRNTS